MDLCTSECPLTPFQACSSTIGNVRIVTRSEYGGQNEAAEKSGEQSDRGQSDSIQPRRFLRKTRLVLDSKHRQM